MTRAPSIMTDTARFLSSTTPASPTARGTAPPSATPVDDRAQDLAAQASSAQRQTCQTVTSLSTCHPAYPTGCSHSANPQYDAYLNLLKTQTPAPSSGISRYITQTSIQSLDASTP